MRTSPPQRRDPEPATGMHAAERVASRATLLFALACLVEGSLVLLAALVAWLAGLPLLAELHWSSVHLLAGAAASLPLVAALWYLMRSPLAPLARIRRFLARFLHTQAAPWTVTQIAIVSTLAGIGEELLFRGVIQGALSAWVGPYPALAAASVLFGCAHLATLGYAVIATVMGLYLGALWLASGNLLVPIATHALYDFVALLYLLRLWRPGEEASQ